MTRTLERITTVYSDTEDRIQLAGQAGEGQPVVIWLTQRLLQRLLPLLLQWLERQQGGATPLAELMQGFAQQAARTGLTPQPPVRFNAGSPAWLAVKVDVNQSDKATRLTFKGAQGQEAVLVLAASALRQWLNILHDASLKAEWPLDVWPAWVRESALPAAQTCNTLH